MEESKIKNKEVWSANKWYLIVGIIFALMTILLETVSIKTFFLASSNDKTHAFILTILQQIPVFVCALYANMISDYVHRVKFNIYYCKLENGIDINYIKENFCITWINEHGVLFVDKENAQNFCIWKKLQGYDSLYQIKTEMFNEKDN